MSNASCHTCGSVLDATLRSPPASCSTLSPAVRSVSRPVLCQARLVLSDLWFPHEFWNQLISCDRTVLRWSPGQAARLKAPLCENHIQILGKPASSPGASLGHLTSCPCTPTHLVPSAPATRSGPAELCSHALRPRVSHCSEASCPRPHISPLPHHPSTAALKDAG